MIKRNTLLDPPTINEDRSIDLIENCPAIPYLEESKYYLAKEEKVYGPTGALLAKKQQWINVNLGLMVDLSWPEKTASVLIAGMGSITGTLMVLYYDVDVLKKILIDASGIRQSQGAAQGGAVKRNI